MKASSKRSAALLLLIILMAAVGLVDSVLVHLKEIESLTDPTAFNSCKINSVIDCGTVASSSYSHIFGMPVSLLGVIFYSAFLTLGATLLSGFRPLRWQLWGISLAALGGLCFSYWLLYISYFGIGALCPYCLVSDGAATVLAITWFIYHRLSTRQ